MATLSEADADRLSKLLAMTASAYDGEVANAARLANKFVRDRGLSWHDVVAPTAVVVTAQPKPRPPPGWPPDPQKVLDDWPRHWTAARAICVARMDSGALSAWDRKFLASFTAWMSPTPKQLTELLRITRAVLSHG